MDQKQILKFLVNYKFMFEIHNALIYAPLEQKTKQYTEADMDDACGPRKLHEKALRESNQIL